MIVQETYNNNVTLTSFNLGKFKVYFIHYNFSLTLLTVIYSCSSVPFVPNPIITNAPICTHLASSLTLGSITVSDVHQVVAGGLSKRFSLVKRVKKLMSFIIEITLKMTTGSHSQDLINKVCRIAFNRSHLILSKPTIKFRICTTIFIRKQQHTL